MLLDKLFSLFSVDMGIDLGTANVLVCVRGEGIVLNEPSVVAVKKGTNQVLLNGNAVGDTAKKMLGKTPGNIVAIRPLKNGVIADFDVTEAMLGYFMRKVHKRSWGVKPRVVIAIPSGITAVEKRAVVNSAENAGAREVILIEEPMAAGIGVGLPITEPTGSMIVDIGGGTTEVAIISLAGIVTSESLRVAGDAMDESIINFMKKKYNLLIGERTSEQIKMQIGSAYPYEQEKVMDVKGRDLMVGLPRTINLSSEEVREALAEPVAAIIQSIKNVLEQAPPEVSSDILDYGITMTGGGALLHGLDQVIADETNIRVMVANDPLYAVAKGTGEVLEQLDTLVPALQSGRED